MSCGVALLPGFMGTATTSPHTEKATPQRFLHTHKKQERKCRHLDKIKSYFRVEIPLQRQLFFEFCPSLQGLINVNKVNAKVRPALVGAQRSHHHQPVNPWKWLFLFPLTKREFIERKQ
jgi:hypothetical protein